MKDLDGLMDWGEWYEMGLRRDWISPAVCYTHDGLPTTSTEDDAWEGGEDPCIHIIRPYADLAERKAVEANCSFAIWRRPHNL